MYLGDLIDSNRLNKIKFKKVRRYLGNMIDSVKFKIINRVAVALRPSNLLGN